MNSLRWLYAFYAEWVAIEQPVWKVWDPRSGLLSTIFVWTLIGLALLVCRHLL